LPARPKDEGATCWKLARKRMVLDPEIETKSQNAICKRFSLYHRHIRKGLQGACHKTADGGVFVV